MEHRRHARGPSAGAIAKRYAELGGPASWLGAPVAEETGMDEGGRVASFEHGEMYWWPDTGVIEINHVVVNYSGLICFGETDSDQLSTADEPYVLLGVVAPTAAVTTRSQIYDDVDAGESRPDWLELYRGKPQGISISTVLMEHDLADPEKYKSTVSAVVRTASAGLGVALVAVPVIGAPLAVVATPLLAAVGPDIAEAVNDLFDFGDDTLGHETLLLSAKQMILLAARTQNTWTQGVGFKAETPLFDSDGATYKAYFAFNPA